MTAALPTLGYYNMQFPLCQPNFTAFRLLKLLSYGRHGYEAASHEAEAEAFAILEAETEAEANDF